MPNRSFGLSNKDNITVSISSPALKTASEDFEKTVQLVNRWNRVALISDGSALGTESNPELILSFLEMKKVVYEKLGHFETMTLALDTHLPEDLLHLITLLAPSVAAINLEAIKDSLSLEIKRRLPEETLPVFHDAQDGTPIVCTAALINALKIVGKNLETIRIVITASETDGLPLVNFLTSAGAKDIVICDRSGAIHHGRPGSTSWIKEELAQKTNPRQFRGSHVKALAGADVFIALSGTTMLNKEIVASMAPKAILFNLTEHDHDFFEAAARGAKDQIVATTRSDIPNRLHNNLVFPGLIRGILDARARSLTTAIKLAVTTALSQMVSNQSLNREFIIPTVTMTELVPTLAKAVIKSVTRNPEPGDR